MARVRAWVLPVAQCDPQVVLYQEDAAHHVLELVRELTPTASVFTVGYGESTERAGTPIKSPTFFLDKPWFKNTADYRFVLSGSPRPWSIAKVLYNETAGRHELTLDVDGHYPGL